MDNSGQTTLELDFEALIARARALADTGSRRILGIAGAPGSGKSTLSAELLPALGDRAVLVGMDGFHLSNSELIRLGKRGRKGAPDTFDVAGYVALLARLRRQRRGTVFAPIFDRSIEESIAAGVGVLAETPLVITEGNYILGSGGGWGNVRRYLDESWFVEVEAAERDARLIRRRMLSGESHDTATAWVHGVDRPNGVVADRSRSRADYVIQATRDTELLHFGIAEKGT